VQFFDFSKNHQIWLLKKIKIKELSILGISKKIRIKELASSRYFENNMIKEQLVMGISKP
jgi:hypothetical protein